MSAAIVATTAPLSMALFSCLVASLSGAIQASSSDTSVAQQMVQFLNFVVFELFPEYPVETVLFFGVLPVMATRLLVVQTRSMITTTTTTSSSSRHLGCGSCQALLHQQPSIDQQPLYKRNDVVYYREKDYVRVGVVVSSVDPTEKKSGLSRKEKHGPSSSFTNTLNMPPLYRVALSGGTTTVLKYQDVLSTIPPVYAK